MCNATFPSSWTMAYHKKKIHYKLTWHKCDICEKVFDDLRKLQKHKKIHCDGEMCPLCFRYFRSEVRLKSHNCLKSENCEVQQFFQCTLCDKSFARSHSLKMHQRSVHEKVINHRCEICDKGFYRLYDKIHHLRVHTNERPYKCDICTFTCRTGSILHEHKRVHTNERPYVCSYPNCGQRFKRSYAMKNHFKLHTGEKKYIRVLF